MIFNSIDFNEYFKILRVGYSILPSINNITKKIPGRNGLKYIRTELGVREIEIDIEIIQTSKELLKQKVRELASLLYTEDLKKLTLPNDDKHYMAKLSDGTDLDELLYIGKTTLVFLCPDPISYGDTQIIDITTNPTNNNVGTHPTKGTITIEITEAVDHIQVTLQETGEYIYLEDDLIIDDVIIIDLEEENITKNGLSAMENLHFESDFFDIPVGEFVIVTNTGDVTLEYIERWL